MLIIPKKRKILRLKTMKEIGLDEDKLQVLFIVDQNNINEYLELSYQFNNSNLQINIFSNLDLEKNSDFVYHNEDLKSLFEICDISYKISDIQNYIYNLEIINNINSLNSLTKEITSVEDDEVSIVLAHCNTVQKIETLIECIQILKKQNQKIILVSHINIDSEILDMVDYFVFDKKNEMIKSHEFNGRGRTYAYSLHNGYYHEHDYDNHAFAVLNLMKTGVGIAKANGYKVAHLIHYDCILYDNSILTNHYNYLKKYDIYHYFYDGYENRIDGNLLSVKVDSFLNVFSQINTKEKYLSYGFAIFENFLKVVLDKSKLSLKKCNIESLFYKNIIDKIQMVDLHHIKEYDDESVTHTYFERVKYLDQNLLVFITNDFNISTAIINQNSYKVVTNIVNAFRVNTDLLESNIQVEIPYLQITKTINSDSRFANCNTFDPSQLNFYDLTV